MEETNTTIDYYNCNADQYFNNTVNVDMSECCDRFLKYIVPGGRIIDIGAGSGRDIKYFMDRGFDVEGLDASEEMCRLAADYTGAEVQCERIQDWKPKKKYDGIWANASLLHLSLDEIEEFISLAVNVLDESGAIYISIKKDVAIGHGTDGRFFTCFSIDTLKNIMRNKSITIKECWNTGDGMDRKDIVWLNVIAQRGE